MYKTHKQILDEILKDQECDKLEDEVYIKRLH